MNDARFEDGNEAALRLIARSAADGEVLSALLQDAVFTLEQASYVRAQRRFALLLNRFRHEEHPGKTPERVRSLLVFDDITAVRTSGIDHAQTTAPLVILALKLAFTEGEGKDESQDKDKGEGADTDEGESGAELCRGRAVLVLANGAEIALDIDVFEARLEDVTKPYTAPSRKHPDHGET